MDIYVQRRRDGWQAKYGVHTFRCAVGKNGIIQNKREGDGCTPIGCWPLRYVLFRPDRLEPPVTNLPVRALAPQLGWCDDPHDPAYNQTVTVPYAASHEALWREDHLYDIIVPLGYNDDPIYPGRGSAIFLHLARGDLEPTEGCVVMKQSELLQVLSTANPRTRLCVLAS